MPLMPVLADIERAGILVDGPALASQSRHIEQELASYTARIYELAGEEFNINSPQQLGRILFEKLRAAGGEEDRQDAIVRRRPPKCSRSWRSSHELPRLVLEWRGLHKLKSTYIDALPLMVHPETGRVHTSFNQAVAATGRLSSSEPEPAEHSDPHGARPRDSARVRRRSGSRADLRRLLADRAARARAHGRRGGAHRSVSSRRGHPRADGG